MSEFKATWEGETGPCLTKGKEYCFSYPLEDDIVSFTDDTGGYHIWSRETMEKDGWSFEIGPIQTETRRVLKEGVYGRLHVESDAKGYISVAFVTMVGEIKEESRVSLSADELESSAMVLSQLAEFLREQDA